MVTGAVASSKRKATEQLGDWVNVMHLVRFQVLTAASMKMAVF
jgi:hypothetical protein